MIFLMVIPVCIISCGIKGSCFSAFLAAFVIVLLMVVFFSFWFFFNFLALHKLCDQHLGGTVTEIS